MKMGMTMLENFISIYWNWIYTYLMTQQFHTYILQKKLYIYMNQKTYKNIYSNIICTSPKLENPNGHQKWLDLFYGVMESLQWIL